MDGGAERRERWQIKPQSHKAGGMPGNRWQKWRCSNKRKAERKSWKGYTHTHTRRNVRKHRGKQWHGDKWGNHHSLESSESYPSTSGSSSFLVACKEAEAPARARSGLSSLGRSLSAAAVVEAEAEEVERAERRGPTWGRVGGRPRGYRGK